MLYCLQLRHLWWESYVKPQTTPLFFFNFYLFIYLFIYGCVGSSFLCEGFSLLAASGGHSSSRCVGLSLSRTLLLRTEHRLQTRRLSNCGPRAQSLRGMWDLPRTGLEPVSPALAGRFSTTAPPGKPLHLFLNYFLKQESNKHLILYTKIMYTPLYLK